MVLRLILVSVVAGLGATPPTENEVADWSRTVQSWLDSRLADWSVCLPLNDEAPPPLAPADLGVVTLDDELLALYGEEPAREAPAPIPAPKANANAGLATWEDELEALFAEESAAVVPAPIEDAQALDRAFDAVVDEMVADFTRSAAEPVAPVTPTPAPDLVAGQAEVDELEQAFVEAEIAESLAHTLVPDPAITSLPIGEHGLGEIGEDSDSAAASGSNLPADEVVPPAPVLEESPTPSQGNACDPLLDAVRLTRDAAYAWMNLLQNPANVTLPE